MDIKSKVLNIIDLKEVEKTILLLGSTGNGKSTLSNFLYYPYWYGKNKIFFPIADDNKPKTQKCSIKSKKSSFKNNKLKLNIIDTPGLNESDVKDIEHILDLLDVIKKLNSIDLVIICVRFDFKIDVQMKYTLDYYTKLFNGSLNKNILVAITNVSYTRNELRKRKFGNVNEDQNAKNILTETKKLLNIDFDIPFVLIDSMVDTDSEDWDIQISRRQFILEKLILCEKLKLENMFFVKTKEIKEDDLNKINKNMGEINGYNKRLIEEEDTKKKNLIDKVQAGLKEINDVKMDIEKMDRSIKEHDNDELITVDVWNAKETWEWFEWLERDFDLKYEILIDKFDKITNGKSNFKIEQENIHQIKGKLIGKFMRGLYASIEVKTKKSTKYASKIISDKKRKRNFNNEVKNLSR